MDSENDIYKMCRLCLAKEQVNVHIFEEKSDEEQIFLKISSCLPIKISYDDRFPKKICLDCSCKLDAMYEFWNKSINSESQLLTWLGPNSVENVSTDDNSLNLHSEIYVKEEAIDVLKTENDIKVEVMEESYDDESYNQRINEFSDQESSHSKRKREDSFGYHVNSNDDPLLQEKDSKCTPPDVIETAFCTIENLLPTKSVQTYEMVYKKFLRWREENHITNFSENVLLAYFSYLTNETKLKSSTMWSQYSMIKSILNIRQGIDISKYLKLRAYLKKQNEGYIPKKSKVLTKQQFDQFLLEASDEKYLGTKIILIIGVFGACRCDEMIKMKIDDIEDLGSLLYVKIPESKTYKTRSFTVVGDNLLNIYRRYIALRPAGMKENRFFIKYENGKCHRLVMGIHGIGRVPQVVASYLKLPNYKEYTGHCLRQTSATLLVDGGADLTCLKRRRGWKSSSVAEGYIEESLVNKTEIAKKKLSNRSNDEIIPADLAMGSSEIQNRNDLAFSSFSVDPNSAMFSHGLSSQNAT